MRIIEKNRKNFGEQKKSLATFSFCAALAVFLGLALFVPAQTASPAPMATPVKPKPISPKPWVRTPPAPAATPEPRTKRKIENPSEGPAEKSIEVDQKVNISLCISSGKLKVNGWNRNEVRAFVDGGTSVGFRVLQSSKVNKKPTGVMILGYDPQKNTGLDLDECLEGNSIELDVPFDTVLNVKSKDSEMTVDSITKVRIENVSGNINIRGVREGVLATTFEGDITVEQSNGSINLLTSAGKVIVFGSSPNEIGEIFRAKSRSGAILLQDVSHTDMEVSSATGSLFFTGALEPGGQYRFTTTNGKIELALPMDTSCKVTATYGGQFETKISFKDIHNYSESGIRKVIALLGDGEAVLTVTTYSGSILIKPRDKK
jgi:DUF4097 and DUF4098 domain-containing protein YvlB